ncbi:DUF2953 domain-containing protein [Ruminococcaceae bacterium OttesenSCG-928-L11]|nr:DUF2953 domain-containing protein [Ruminococcaceae bacterium OttesenSCG-928-L11]
MLALWIILGLIGLLFLLLCFPVSVRVEHGGETTVHIRYLFLRFRVFPMQDKPRKKRTDSQKRKRKSRKKEKPAEETASLTQTIDMVLSLLKSSRWSLGLLRRHLVFSDVKLFILIGGEDAADVAIQYGKFCAVCYPALGTICSWFTVKSPAICIVPGFTRTRNEYDVGVTARIIPHFAILAALGLAVRFLVLLAKSQSKRSNPPQPKSKKGGRNYESAKSSSQ